MVTFPEIFSLRSKNEKKSKRIYQNSQWNLHFKSLSGISLSKYVFFDPRKDSHLFQEGCFRIKEY